MADLVLVTGASGYIAGHCVRELLEHGYDVRGTVRSLAATEKVAHLRTLAETLPGSLSFVEADLESDVGWPEAVKGCAYVMHVASPNPPTVPKHEEDLIRPALDGTLRVLRACADAGTVKRVVLTSSIAAIIFGEDHRDDVVRTEADWSDPAHCAAYAKSKTLAERAAWDFVTALPAGQKFELAVVNPGFVMGPLMRHEYATSLEGIRRLLARQTPGSPEIGFAAVDVRDTAVLHRLAMERPEAAGNRYLCAGEHIWMLDIAKILADEFNPQGYNVPTARLPYWVLWAIGRFDKTVRMALGFIGRKELVTADKAVRELGWTMRPARESVVDSARSLIEYGIVPARTPRPA